MRVAISQAALASAQVTADSGTQSFRFNESFIGFEGHFPDYPILPAVLQTLLAQLLAEQIVGEPLQLLGLERAKFTRQLQPGERIDVSLNCQEKDGQLRCPAKLTVGTMSAASFTLTLGRGDAP